MQNVDDPWAAEQRADGWVRAPKETKDPSHTLEI